MTSRIVGRTLLIAAATLTAAGCSLITVKSPERPLSPRDLAARTLTRDFSDHFIAVVAQCADEIGSRDSDPAVQVNALRWKIAAASESERAATRIAPVMALLDTWTFTAQMRAFLSPGQPGGELFGSQQQAALAVATGLDAEAQQLARRVLAADELPAYQRFVESYTREYPLKDLEMVRPSVVMVWTESQGTDFKVIDSFGTIPQAMTDVSDRARISSEGLARQTMWRTELALRTSGYGTGDLRAALKQLDERLASLTAAADNAPQTLKQAIDEARSSMIDVLNRVDASSAAVIEGLRREREALATEVRGERESIVEAADAERRALTADAARIADQAVRSAGAEVRRLAREVLVLFIILAAVVLGLPFAAGYLVGRARAGRA